MSEPTTAQLAMIVMAKGLNKLNDALDGGHGEDFEPLAKVVAAASFAYEQADDYEDRRERDRAFARAFLVAADVQRANISSDEFMQREPRAFWDLADSVKKLADELHDGLSAPQ